jgi:hypothetical protein
VGTGNDNSVAYAVALGSIVKKNACVTTRHTVTIAITRRCINTCHCFGEEKTINDTTHSLSIQGTSWQMRRFFTF